MRTGSASGVGSFAQPIDLSIDSAQSATNFQFFIKVLPHAGGFPRMKHLCRATVNRAVWRRQRLRARVVLDRDLGRVADLLDHEVALFASHHAGDAQVLVAGRDDEALRVAAYLLVGRARQLDALQTVQVAALADEADAEGVALAANVEALRHVLDPLVELPEEGLVPSDPLLTHRHRRIISEFSPLGKVEEAKAWDGA